MDEFASILWAAIDCQCSKWVSIGRCRHGAGAESSGGMTGVTTAGSEPWLKFEDWDRVIE